MNASQCAARISPTATTPPRGGPNRNSPSLPRTAHRTTTEAAPSARRKNTMTGAETSISLTRTPIEPQTRPQTISSRYPVRERMASVRSLYPRAPGGRSDHERRRAEVDQNAPLARGAQRRARRPAVRDERHVGLDALGRRNECFERPLRFGLARLRRKQPQPTAD